MSNKNVLLSINKMFYSEWGRMTAVSTFLENLVLYLRLDSYSTHMVDALTE